MKIIWISVLILLVVCIGSLHAEGKAQPFTVEWKPIAGASGYMMQVRDEQGKIRLSEKLSGSVTLYELWLPAGTYQIRIGTLNEKKETDRFSKWTPIRVDLQSPPSILSIAALKIMTDKTAELLFSASEMASNTRVFLLAPSGKRIAATLARKSAQDWALAVPGLQETGSYALVLVNPPDLEAQKTDAVLVEPIPLPAFTEDPSPPVSPPVSEPLSAKGDSFGNLYFGAGLDIHSIVAGEWKAVYPGFYPGCSLSAEIRRPVGHLNMHPLSFGLGASASYVQYAPKDSVNPSMNTIGFLVRPALLLDIGSLTFRLQLGVGLEYCGVHGGLTAHDSTLDMCGSFLVGADWMFLPHQGLDIGLEYLLDNYVVRMGTANIKIGYLYRP